MLVKRGGLQRVPVVKGASLLGICDLMAILALGLTVVGKSRFPSGMTTKGMTTRFGVRSGHGVFLFLPVGGGVVGG